MQVFITNPNNLIESAQSLDDLRLRKQIVEIAQLLNIRANEVMFDLKKQGHQSHPIYNHYKNNMKFLIEYLEELNEEYIFRFNKYPITYWTLEGFKNTLYQFVVFGTPAYIKGKDIEKTQVGLRYRKLLIEKWNNDIKEPKWTNRNVPQFYKRREL